MCVCVCVRFRACAFVCVCKHTFTNIYTVLAQCFYDVNMHGCMCESLDLRGCFQQNWASENKGGNSSKTQWEHNTRAYIKMASGTRPPYCRHTVNVYPCVITFHDKTVIRPINHTHIVMETWHSRLSCCMGYVSDHLFHILYFYVCVRHALLIVRGRY